jgi:hypothetical protein
VTKRRPGRLMSAIAFWVLLLDGALAIWLGQMSGRVPLIITGLVLLAAAGGVVFGYRRWQRRIAEIEEARDELKAEIALLRNAVDQARGRQSGG